MKRSLSHRSLKHFWNPCAQMKDFEKVSLLEIASAQGCYLETTSGKKILDGISSWWCKSLGHGHPQLRKALSEQMNLVEHVMMGSTTNETIVRLSEKLTELLPSLTKVCYASDGSSAVEAALKMSLHAHQICGEGRRKKFMALANAYHGETLGALSVSDVGIYKEAHQEHLFPITVIRTIPYLLSREDPLWSNCESHWQCVEKELSKEADQLTAIIVEPVVQGGGGMKIYSADFLRRLRIWTKEHKVHLIADEIMTGLGRTGKMLACEYAAVEPDFLCLSKGLTAGFLPMSALLTTQEIYDCFYDDHEKRKSFLHSHTFSGHVLAAAVACEVLEIIQSESLVQRAVWLEKMMLQRLQEVAEEFSFLENVRSLGAIAAAEVVLPLKERLSLLFLREAEASGIFLRPMDKTLYWFPPLIAGLEELDLLQKGTRRVLEKCQRVLTR